MNIYRELAVKNPDAYNMVLARTCSNMAIFYYKQYKKDSTQKELKTKGITLLEEAENCLVIYDTHPTAQKFRELIIQYKNDFENITAK